MARHGKYPIRAITGDRGIVNGSFIVNGSTPTSVNGKGFSVARAGAGLYDVTLTDAGVLIETVLAFVHGKTEATELFCYGDIDALTTSVFRIQVANLGGANAEVNGDRIDFIAIVKDTSL